MKVLIAEDQMINMAVLKQSLSDLQLTGRCEFAFNGQEAVSKARDIVTRQYEASREWRQGGASIQPLCLVLTDFQMPKLNGIQVVEQIKKAIADLNAYYEEGDCLILEPLFVLQTAYFSQAFRKYIANIKVQGVYEKPMKKESILEIMRMITD